MKRVAPTDLPGPHCVRTREAKECVRLRQCLKLGPSCALHQVALSRVVHGAEVVPVKCDVCRDALTELEDR